MRLAEKSISEYYEWIELEILMRVNYVGMSANPRLLAVPEPLKIIILVPMVRKFVNPC
jgi:hypothetical protein